ncbi:MAG: hypothetical protein F4X94_00815 [Dehalococcoidia bacterium]|nr:hypothetical protein [Dehalococcoidia bacterium]
MVNDSKEYDDQGRPVISLQNSHDVDTAQHFLSDHAAELIVSFDHHARDPEVYIYIETPDGRLSAGDYYLWPLLHRTAKRIVAKVEERRRQQDRGSWRWDYHRRSIRKWANRMPLLHTLIRIRKSTVHALCAWDLQGKRPKALVVLNTDRNLTGLTREEALDMVNTD